MINRAVILFSTVGVSKASIIFKNFWLIPQVLGSTAGKCSIYDEHTEGKEGVNVFGVLLFTASAERFV